MSTNPTQTARLETEHDSALDTILHSRRVDELMLQTIVEIQDRLTKHDQSKLEDPEKSTFDEHTHRLKYSTYGSPEYFNFLREMKPALDHHYCVNRHHPEHFVDGVGGMNLIDVIEMLSDWKASSERHEDGDLRKSLEIQRERFNLSPQVFAILRNTCVDLGWIEGD